MPVPRVGKPADVAYPKRDHWPLNIVANEKLPVNAQKKANITKAKTEIRAFESALKLYRLDNFAYPTSEQGLDALVTRPNDPNIRNWNPSGYMERKSIPLDPWGNPYQYLNPGNNGEIDIYSFGADGRPGEVLLNPGEPAAESLLEQQGVLMAAETTMPHPPIWRPLSPLILP